MSSKSRFRRLFQPPIVDRRLPWLFGGMSVSLLLLGCSLALAIFCGFSLLFNGFLFWQTTNLSVAPVEPPVQPTVLVVVAPDEPPLTPTVTPLLPTATPTGIIPPATVTPGLPTPTPHTLEDFTIEKLRARVYPGGVIQVRDVLTETAHYTSYYIDYPSDGLTITGVMQIPVGPGPFPVIILNHGYIDREDYWPGADTWRAAAYLNRHGYLTIAPDFRSWGESDVGNSFFSTGQVIDALNLISSLDSVPEADLQRVGMWGHSMGGGVTMKVITLDSRIGAAVLYAPVSANDAEVLERWGPGCLPDQPNPLYAECGGAEVLVSEIDETLFWGYNEAVGNPQLLAKTSPINYTYLVQAPVQIHIGSADTTTPPVWSQTIYQYLRAAGKSVEYYNYEGQGHALNGQSWQLFMQRTVDFLDQHLNRDQLLAGGGVPVDADAEPQVIAAAPSPTATATPTSTPIVPSLTLSEDLLPRLGPGNEHAQLGQIRAGSVWVITGRNAANDWWRIAYSGAAAWVPAKAGVAQNTADVPLASAAAISIPAQTAPQAASPARQPTATPTLLPPPAVDFAIIKQRLWTNEENGGISHNGSATSCGFGHEIYVTVIDAAGQPLDGVVIADTYDNPRQITGSIGPGRAQYILYGNGYNLFVAEDPQAGPDISSDVSQVLSAKDTEILIPWLINAHYCADEAECEKRASEGGLCWGHYSYDITFQRAW